MIYDHSFILEDNEIYMSVREGILYIRIIDNGCKVIFETSINKLVVSGYNMQEEIYYSTVYDMKEVVDSIYSSIDNDYIKLDIKDEYILLNNIDEYYNFSIKLPLVTSFRVCFSNQMTE